MPGTTPVYGWPFQALTDSPDGAALGEDLALAIEDTLADATSRLVMKANDTSRASTTTASADSELSISLGPGNWRVDVWIVMDGDGGDIKITYDSSGTSNSRRMCMGPQIGVTDMAVTTMRWFSTTGLTAEIPYGTLSTDSMIHEILVTQVDTAATITVSWAQNSSNVNATRVFNRSFIQAIKIP